MCSMVRGHDLRSSDMTRFTLVKWRLENGERARTKNSYDVSAPCGDVPMGTYMVDCGQSTSTATVATSGTSEPTHLRTWANAHLRTTTTYDSVPQRETAEGNCPRPTSREGAVMHVHEHEHGMGMA